MTKKAEKSEKQKNEEVLKMNKWDGSAVKHALDDAVKNCLLSSQPQLKEQFGLVNTRLFFCGLAVTIALLAHVWDYTHPFPQSYNVLLFSVLGYFFVMALLTLHTTFREKGAFLVAKQTNAKTSDHIWTVSSYMNKYDDIYTLIVSMANGKSVSEAKSSHSCATFIDINGTVLPHLVSNEINRLCNSVSADSKKN